MLFGWLETLRGWWQKRNRSAAQRPPSLDRPSVERLERIILTDGVARTLFEDYQDHRCTERGDEEIGWLLLGERHGSAAIARAALPAGMMRDAGAAHVLFNSDVQELASHILRENDKRLIILGVVHTHPGNLRQPSDGDLRGDRLWVHQLRGGEGAFGIGTADARSESQADHQQRFNDLCFSWYALGRDDTLYRTLPVQVTFGPDLAKPLHVVWDLLETHARLLNRLYRQFANVRCKIAEEESAPLLVVSIALPEPNQRLRLLLNHEQARYYWERDGAFHSVDPREPQVDRAVFLIMAEIAKSPSLAECESLVES